MTEAPRRSLNFISIFRSAITITSINKNRILNKTSAGGRPEFDWRVVGTGRRPISGAEISRSFKTHLPISRHVGADDEIVGFLYVERPLVSVPGCVCRWYSKELEGFRTGGGADVPSTKTSDRLIVCGVSITSDA